MRSIPRALIWETLHHGRWNLLAGGLGASTLTTVLFVLLESNGPIDRNDPSYPLLCVILVQIQLFILGITVINAQGQPSRLYGAPITTSTLVTWHMLFAALLVSVELLVSTLALNSLFNLNWPIWGPALFAVAAVPAMQAAFWQTDKSRWLPIGMGLVAACLGLAFKSRFGPTFGVSEHMWTNITVPEVTAVLAVVGVSYYAAVAGVARTRRGDALQTPRVIVAIFRAFEQLRSPDRTFRTLEQAQFWFEWRQKGRAIPVCVVLGLVGGLGIWAVFNRHPLDLVQGFLAGGALLSGVAMVGGILFGNTGSSDKNMEISQFLACRPMTNSQLSHTILQVAARSVFVAWFIWAAAFLVSYLVALAVGVTLRPPGFINLYWMLPMTLLGPWIVATAGASLCLTGRRWLLPQVICGGMALFIGINLLSFSAFTHEGRLIFVRTVVEMVGALLILGSTLAVIVAWRRAMISTATVCIAASLWLGASALVMLIRVNTLNAQHPTLILIGLLALAVAPIATAPLALAWNRNR